METTEAAEPGDPELSEGHGCLNPVRWFESITWDSMRRRDTRAFGLNRRRGKARRLERHQPLRCLSSLCYLLFKRGCLVLLEFTAS